MLDGFAVAASVWRSRPGRRCDELSKIISTQTNDRVISNELLIHNNTTADNEMTMTLMSPY